MAKLRDVAEKIREGNLDVALKGYASGILDGIANTPQKKFHYIEMISRTVENMERLVDSLFLFSKLDLGRIEFKLEPVCLTSISRIFRRTKKIHWLNAA